MKTFVAFACLLALVAANVDDDAYVRREFRLFEQKYNKQYASHTEREARLQIFKTNLAKIQRHNLSGKTWTEAINQFGDLTPEEFRSTRLNGYVNMQTPSSKHQKPYTGPKIDTTQLPSSWDWRDQGAITPVKDQGACGSCWAFAAVQMIESYAFLESGQLLELSAQQLTSCTPNNLECGGTGGCSGGIPQQAFGYTQLFGIVTDAEMPYTSGNFGATGDCDWDSTTMQASAYTMGYEVLARNDYDVAINHMANIGPLAVAVDASAWQFYSTGIFDGCSVTNDIVINHAVQMVGYGTDAEGDFWTVRNSWGAGYGESGYIRLRRDANPECGTDNTPLYGTACVNDGQESQYVCGTCAVLFESSYPVGTTLVV